jgi:uncharacterized protein YbaP (TraB family)
MVRAFRLIAAACALALAAGPALAAPPVWVVKDADSTIVLFGSVHILPSGLDWRPPALIAALAQADDLWFEIPTDPATAARIAQLAQQRALLPPDSRLATLLDGRTRARLNRVVASLKLSPEQINQMRPWMAEIQVMVAYLQSRGADASDGVEETITALAPPTAQHRAFETAEQQIDMLSGGSMTSQVASLKETLREIEADPEGFDRMLRAWMSGDPRRLAHEALDPMIKATPDLYATLVRDRNTAWTGTIQERLKGAGRTVIVVGAGHLVGPDSVPAQLRARGVTVEGP